MRVLAFHLQHGERISETIHDMEFQIMNNKNRCQFDIQESLTKHGVVSMESVITPLILHWKFCVLLSTFYQTVWLLAILSFNLQVCEWVISSWCFNARAHTHTHIIMVTDSLQLQDEYWQVNQTVLNKILTNFHIWSLLLLYFCIAGNRDCVCVCVHNIYTHTYICVCIYIHI